MMKKIIIIFGMLALLLNSCREQDLVSGNQVKDITAQEFLEQNKGKKEFLEREYLTNYGLEFQKLFYRTLAKEDKVNLWIDKLEYVKKREDLDAEKLNTINLILEDLKNQGFANQIKLLKTIEESRFTNEEKILFFSTLSNYNDKKTDIIFPTISFRMPDPGSGQCYTRWCTDCPEFQPCTGDCYNDGSLGCGALWVQSCDKICK